MAIYQNSCIFCNKKKFTKSPLGINLLTPEIKISQENSGVTLNQLHKPGQHFPLSGWKEGSVWLGVRKESGCWWRLEGWLAGGWWGEVVGGSEGRWAKGRDLGIFLPTSLSWAPGKGFLSPDAWFPLSRSGRTLCALEKAVMDVVRQSTGGQTDTIIVHIWYS